MIPAALAAAIAAEVAASPQGSRIKHEDRILLADGDALAYSQAGSKGTPLWQARENLLSKVGAAARIAGAGSIKILTTAQSSPKGFRFAVARRKPYQGHRGGSKKPDNWEGLRRMLEDGTIPNVEMTTTVEADDLFGKWSTINGPENTVIYTEDKDMRMISGWHLNWQDHTMVYVPEGAWEVVHNGKVYGRKWFWLQMLQGDNADNIPGLPNLSPEGLRSGLVGPATATRLLSGTSNNSDARSVVLESYKKFYGEDYYEVELLEQGILLWMRTDLNSSVWDVTSVGNPLDNIRDPNIIAVIKDRIRGSL